MIGSISQIVLKPRRPQFEPRVMPFEPSQVNVITGYSRKGKSAILHIVDYCLASSECRIPVGLRDAISEVETAFRLRDGRVLALSRQVPSSITAEQGKVPDRVLWRLDHPSSSTASEPESLTIEAAKDRLSMLVGLPDLSFRVAEEGKSQGFDARPGFRDLVAFLFQPQSLVANSESLFYKADTYDHREKLKRVLPLVLGLTTSQILAWEHELDGIRKSLSELERRAKAHADAVARGDDRLWAAAVRLREVGLLGAAASELDSKAKPSIATLRTLILSAIATWRQSGQLHAGKTADAVDRIVELQNSIEVVERRLFDARTRLQRLRRLKTATVEFSAAKSIEADYLKGASWLSELKPGDSCPLCQSKSMDASKEIESVRSLALVISKQRENADDVRKGLLKSVEDQAGEIRRMEADLVSRRQALTQLLGDKAKPTQSPEAIGVLIAEAEFLCDRAQAGEKNPEAVQLTDLRERARTLTAQISAAKNRGSEVSRQDRLKAMITRYAEMIEVEGAEQGVSIDVKELTVRVGAHLLSEQGSGANHMGCHVAALLGLHEFLVQMESDSPVPRFIIFDQPSQVYFPAGERNARVATDNFTGRDEDDKDLDGIRRVFEAMVDAVKQTRGALQIIVCEHAAGNVWRRFEGDGLKLAAEWHNENDALVPNEWLRPT